MYTMHQHTYATLLFPTVWALLLWLPCAAVVVVVVVVVSAAFVALVARVLATFPGQPSIVADWDPQLACKVVLPSCWPPLP